MAVPRRITASPESGKRPRVSSTFRPLSPTTLLIVKACCAISKRISAGFAFRVGFSLAQAFAPGNLGAARRIPALSGAFFEEAPEGAEVSCHAPNVPGVNAWAGERSVGRSDEATRHTPGSCEGHGNRSEVLEPRPAKALDPPPARLSRRRGRTSRRDTMALAAELLGHRRPPVHQLYSRWARSQNARRVIVSCRGGFRMVDRGRRCLFGLGRVG
jgi:hypothetical protein